MGIRGIRGFAEAASMVITLSNTEIKVLTNVKSYVHKILSAWRLNMALRMVEEEDTSQEIVSFSLVPQREDAVDLITI